MSMKNLLATVLIIASSINAFAHEGHGSETSLSPKHYLVNPEHLLPVLLAIGVVAILGIWYRSRRSKTLRQKK